MLTWAHGHQLNSITDFVSARVEKETTFNHAISTRPRFGWLRFALQCVVHIDIRDALVPDNQPTQGENWMDWGLRPDTHRNSGGKRRAP
jgi:hypothetical protein